MRAYNVSWARAKAFSDLTLVLGSAEQRMLDLRKRIDKIKEKNETTTAR